MDTVETSTPTETPSETAPETSLADHEAQFGPPAKRDPQATPTNGAAPDDADADRDAGRFRQRARSQHASPKDVEQIAEYTKRLRQAESDLGLKIEKQPGESDRAFSLRRQAEIAEGYRDARKQRTEPTGHEQARPAPVPLGAFEEKEPQPEDFANDANPLAAYIKAMNAYEWKRQIHDAQTALNEQRAKESHAQAVARSEETKRALDARIADYEKTAPGFWQRLDAVDVPELRIPDVLAAAIVKDVDSAPKLMDYLATHPDVLEDAISFSLPFMDDFTEPTVALLRRRLNRYVRDIDAKTGASPLAHAAVTVAPRPPTPVRTGPLKTGDEPLSDDSSLADHEARYGPKRRR